MNRIRTTRIALLVPLLLVAASGALVQVAAAYGGWPTVSGSGSYTALVPDIDASPLHCAFTFKVREFKETLQGSLEVSLVNDAVTLTLQATTFTDLQLEATYARIVGTGDLWYNGMPILVTFEVEIEDTDVEEYVVLRFGPIGADPTIVPGDSPDYAGRITIKC
jgi:hypothetical protein